MGYEPWMLAAMDRAGYNGITDAHIEAVAREIMEAGIAQVTRKVFDEVCHRCGIDPDNFTQDDLDRLEEQLNRY